MLMYWLTLNQTEHCVCVCVLALRTPGTLLTLLPVSPVSAELLNAGQPTVHVEEFTGQEGESSQLSCDCLWVLCLYRVHTHPT